MMSMAGVSATTGLCTSLNPHCTQTAFQRFSSTGFLADRELESDDDIPPYLQYHSADYLGDLIVLNNSDNLVLRSVS